VSTRDEYSAAVLVPPRARRARGRPRSQHARQAILDAALDLLERDGYRAVTIEAIAAQARVGKPTIYRWWPSKAAVVLDAFVTRARTQVPVPQRGSLREELGEFLETAFQTLGSGAAPIVRGLMAEAQTDPVFRQAFWDIFISARRGALAEVLERGVQRRELPENTDVDFLIDAIYGPMWYRLLVQHAPVDATLAHQLVDLVTVRAPVCP